MKSIATLFLYFLFLNIYAQNKNEIALQTSISNIGISYERATENHFSFGTGIGTGLFSVKKDELAVMSSSNFSSRNKTNYYFSPFIRYYFRNDFTSLFLLAEYYQSNVTSTIYKDGQPSNVYQKKYAGPLLGAGYKLKTHDHFVFNFYVAFGYDFNENDLIPVLADGFLSFGYQF